MSDEIRIELTVRTDRLGSQTDTVIPFDREDWEAMSPLEQDKAILEELLTSGLIEWNYEEVN